MNFIEFIKFEWSSGNWFQRAMMVAMGVLIAGMLTIVSLLLVALIGSLTAKDVATLLFSIVLVGGLMSFAFTCVDYEDWKDNNGKPRKKLTNFGPK